MKITKFYKATAGGFLFLVMSLLSSAPGFAQGMKREDFFLKPLTSGGVGAVSGAESVCVGAGLATTAASVSGNVATLTMASSPITAGFVNGRTIQVINFTGSDTYFNGTFTLTSVTSTTLVYALSHANNSASTNGGAVMNPTVSAGCAPLTTVYSDKALTQVISQSFPDDGKGNTFFYAVPGDYWVAYSASGLNPIPMTLVTLPLAPGTGGNLVSPTISNPTITGTDNGAETLQNKNLSDTTTNIVNAADATKKLNIDTSSNTTGITGTLKTAYTTNKQTFFPDAAGTLAWGTGGFTTGNMVSVGPGAVLQLIDSGFLPSGVVYNTPSASTNASITATTMANVGASGGMYRISFYADQSALGSGCSTNTTINLAVVYRDPNGTSNQAQTVGAVLTIVNNGTVGNVLTGGNAAASWVYGFRSKASNVVQYQTTYNIGTCTTGPSYTLWPILEQLN